MALKNKIRTMSGTEADGRRLESESKCPLSLGGFDQVIDMDMKVIVIFDVVDRGLGWDLVDNQACSLDALVSNILHLFPHQTLRLFSWLPVCRQQVLVFCFRQNPEVSISIVVPQLVHIKNGVLFISDIIPVGHDWRSGEDHASPLILLSVLLFKEMLYSFAHQLLRPWRYLDLVVYDIFRQDLEVRHSVVLEQLDAVDAVKTVILHHKERGVHAKPVQYCSLPLALVALLAPVMLNADSQNAVWVWGQGVTQLPATPLSGKTE